MHLSVGDFFRRFRNGAPVREKSTAGKFTELPCESSALFCRARFQALSKRSSRSNVVHCAKVHVALTRSSRARVVHCGKVHAAPVREWCTFFQRTFSGAFETKLPCESGALRESSRSSRARAVHFSLGGVFRRFRNEAPVREWRTASSRSSCARVVPFF